MELQGKPAVVISHLPAEMSRGFGRDLTVEMSAQCRACTRALHREK